jgi:hypothetical protein
LFQDSRPFQRLRLATAAGDKETIRRGCYGRRELCRYVLTTRIPPMTELLLTVGLLALLGVLVWLGMGSDDDNGGGGLMEPALVPIPIRRR